MRTAARLLAIVKPERFLEAGNPTGLTGLYTHPNPRPTLLLLYDETLERLKSFPEHSVYRQAAEAVTRHRMNILNSIKPSGYNEWAERARKLIEENKAYIRKIQESQIEADAESRPPGNYKVPSTPIDHNEADDEYVDTVEWDGQKAPNGLLDGVRSSEEGADQKYLVQMRLASIRKGLKWEDEPPLEASQYVKFRILLFSCSRLTIWY